MKLYYAHSEESLASVVPTPGGWYKGKKNTLVLGCETPRLGNYGEYFLWKDRVFNCNGENVERP